MPGRADLLGELLAREGLVQASELEELLEVQRRPMPLASLCYVLDIADEERLAQLLSRQRGVPAVVLDRSIIHLEVLSGPAAEIALEQRALPLAEDRHHVLVAVDDPDAAQDLLREIEFVRGKKVVPHLALSVTLARTLRACVQARACGETLWVGPLAGEGHRPASGSLYVVSEACPAPPGSLLARAHHAVIEDVTKEVLYETVLGLEEVTVNDDDGPDGPDGAAARVRDEARPAAEAGTGRPISEVSEVSAESGAATPVRLGGGTPGPVGMPEPADGAMPAPIPAAESGRLPLVSASTALRHIVRPGGIQVIDLDSAEGAAYHPFHAPPARVLIVDDDFASRQLLMKELAPLTYQIESASDGSSALELITATTPDAVVVDIMLPVVDGFQICRAIKQSRKYRQIAVVLMSAVIDSGRVTDEVLRQYGADAYFEKPVHHDRLRRRLKTLLAARGADQAPGGERSFERAIALYRAGDVNGAVGELRRGLAEDPLSAKHHFVLANLLHKKSLIYEAIDEYEATLELKPDYFPALTRLAYLYYKQGLPAKAVDTWRRSLPLCPDPALRKNIEVFMLKLIGDLNQRG